MVQLKSNTGEVIAGAITRSFGDCLLLDTLGVCEALPGQDIGRQILNKVEQVGKFRACLKCFLHSLDFQAMPFYKPQGYQV
ncbi:GNAT family N-acetyltransferase [Agarivorans sp. Z349TD_8]|uniref:GNAT family N-acetyltransferase n=1 Tax=Agarivorans sp. Z349TD_8 TaxID=3421434 RepID=UPI003D7C6411